MKSLIRFLHSITIICLTAYLSYPQILTIHHFDVGQGDATLIRAQHGKTVLIDAGSRGKGGEVVYPFLRNNGITSIDIVMASHFHVDHIGGLDEILQSFHHDSIRLIIDRGYNPLLPESKSFSEYRTIVNQYPSHIIATPGQTFILGKQVSLKCVATDGSVLGYGEVPNARSDENNLSIAWILSAESLTGGKKYLFRYFTGGDCGGTSEHYADLETPLASIVGDVDVMKVNHHGSRYSTNSIFLDSLRPEAVIISVGNNNRYGHPAIETINRLNHSPSIRSIYQTQSGNLYAATFTTKNQKIREKVKVIGTVKVSVFDSFYTVGVDTYTLGFQEYNQKKSDTLLMPAAEDTNVTITVYNILGKFVGSLKKHARDEDEYKRSLERENLPSGVYFLLYELPSRTLIRKVVHIR